MKPNQYLENQRIELRASIARLEAQQTGIERSLDRKRSELAEIETALRETAPLAPSVAKPQLHNKPDWLKTEAQE